jgi:RNA polymerase sigma-70 factor, ECF subfamily
LAASPAPSKKEPSLAEPVRLSPAIALSDRELAERVVAGDRWAEEAVFRRFLPDLHGTVRRLLANSVDADDVVQDTFATAFEIWGQLRDPSKLRQWLMQIAIRKVHRRFRRRRLLRALGLDKSADDATLELSAHAGTDAETRAELGMLDRLLAELPTHDRVAWMLRHVEGLALDEVANECGCSLATVKRRIAAAQARISAHVQVAGP